MCRKHFPTLIAAALCSLAGTVSHAQMPDSGKQNCDSLYASLVTCWPGSLIYELYGHTAIRIKNTLTGEDWAFNYGMFSFDTPGFVMRFICGRTDYMLGVYPYGYFLEEYMERGSMVVEQELNLTVREKSRLYAALLVNARPENRTYRYNFLYNNCTTQARDIIERSVDGRIEYPPDGKAETYRSIIHTYASQSPWAEFGQDILLGAESDRPATQRQKMFAPLFFMKYADKAVVLSPGGGRRTLVKDTKTAVPAGTLRESTGFPLKPDMAAGIVLAVTAAVCAASLCLNKIWWGWEAALMTVQGLAGCITTFMFFFSELPTVGTNWLVAILNPVPLVYLPFRVRRIMKCRYDAYTPVAFAVETLFFIAMPLIPQDFSPAVYCFALSLCLHSATCAYMQNRLGWRKR